MADNETPEQPEGEPAQVELVEPPNVLATVLPDGNIDLHINGLAPWAVIGICETVKQQMLQMTTGQSNSGLVVPQRGITLDHLRKGGRN